MSKKVIITINEMPSMRGRYTHTLSINKRRVSTGNHAGYDPADAAAKAVELAINNPGEYSIFAPNAVLDLIPANLRSGEMR